MSPLKTKTRWLGGRLVKTALSSAVAFSAVAGGVMLFGGEAKAVATICATYPPSFVPVPCVNGDWTLTTIIGAPAPTPNPFVTNGSGPSLSAIFDMEDVGTFPLPDQAVVDVDFDPVAAPHSGEWWYSITTTDHNITQAKLSVAIPNIGGQGTVKKFIYSDPSFTTLIDTLEVNQTTTTALSTVPFDLKTIYVKDVWNSQLLGIDSFQNSYVPGPLPILGAGAAFGFSRKLRGRIKASRTA